MYWGWLEMETANCLLETAACWAALASLSPQLPLPTLTSFPFLRPISQPRVRGRFGFQVSAPLPILLLT